jgi:hypothetical protein
MARRQQEIGVRIVNPERLEHASETFTKLITKYWIEEELKKEKSEEIKVHKLQQITG